VHLVGFYYKNLSRYFYLLHRVRVVLEKLTVSQLVSLICPWLEPSGRLLGARPTIVKPL